MPEPVIIAVPSKGGTLTAVLRRLIDIGWIADALVDRVLRMVKDDKQRIKLEEMLIRIHDELGDGIDDGSIRAQAVADGVEGADVDIALERMRRFTDSTGRRRLGFTPKEVVHEMLEGYYADVDMREAAMTMHLELDVARFGRPTRIMFDHMEFSWVPPGRQHPVQGLLVGTDHEITPTYLRKHKRDLSLTCYDAFHNTLLDALDTGKVHHWHDMMAHLKEANTDVRILGSLGLEDYLGHFVLMPDDMAERARAAGIHSWNSIDHPEQLALLRERPVLIDAAYEEVYKQLLDATSNGITFEPTTGDIEELCAQENRCAIYIVQSGGTIARTPNLNVVGEELIRSETIVAVNRERLDNNLNVGVLADSLSATTDDGSARWRTRLAERLGTKLV